jgi:hypothetical protein
VKKPSGSYSAIKAFETCAKQYYEVKLAKNYPEPAWDESDYGTRFHKAAEDFVRDGTPLPDEFNFAGSALRRLRDMPGEKLCEVKLAVNSNLAPVEFFDKGVLYRGIADLVIVNGSHAKSIDYKTGKSAKYADRGQLELVALMLFAKFPELEVIDGALFYVIAKAFLTNKITRKEAPQLWEKWLAKYGRLLLAYEKNVWNPRPSGLCRRHCVVDSCPHHGGY